MSVCGLMSVIIVVCGHRIQIRTLLLAMIQQFHEPVEIGWNGAKLHDVVSWGGPSEWVVFVAPNNEVIRRMQEDTREYVICKNVGVFTVFFADNLSVLLGGI